MKNFLINRLKEVAPCSDKILHYHVFEPTRQLQEGLKTSKKSQRRFERSIAVAFEPSAFDLSFEWRRDALPYLFPTTRSRFREKLLELSCRLAFKLKRSFVIFFRFLRFCSLAYFECVTAKKLCFGKLNWSDSFDKRFYKFVLKLKCLLIMKKCFAIKRGDAY